MGIYKGFPQTLPRSAFSGITLFNLEGACVGINCAVLAFGKSRKQGVIILPKYVNFLQTESHRNLEWKPNEEGYIRKRKNGERM